MITVKTLEIIPAHHCVDTRNATTRICCFIGHRSFATVLNKNVRVAQTHLTEANSN